MFSKTNKTNKSFIATIGMCLVLLMVSALGFFVETRVRQIAPPSIDSWSNTEYMSAPSGGGVDGNPYRVTKAEELAWFLKNGTSAYVVLENDIDLAEHTWSGISTSITNFDGQNHTIANLNGSSGLFGYANVATISNLVMSNVNIYSSGMYVGAVLNRPGNSCLIDNVEVSSGNISLKGAPGYIGGILGTYGGVSNITIKNCINNASIVCNALMGGSSTAGGIVGNVDTQTTEIINCINTGNITGIGTYTSSQFQLNIGGISGDVGQIKNCYVECDLTGFVAGRCYIGGICGGRSSGFGSISNSGFNGKIILNGEGVNGNIGSICGEGVGAVVNSYGVADINVQSEELVNVLGVNTGSTFTSSYSYSDVVVANKRTELRKYKVNANETEPFGEFGYHKNVNGGFPFPRSLFAVGQFFECDTLNYLETYGFEGVRIKNDGTHYYVELGEYPQTYVGDELNSSLKVWYESSNPEVAGSYSKAGSSSGYNTYIYTDGNIYLRVPSAALNSSSNYYDFNFENGTTKIVSGEEYWFKIEPLKWWVLNYSDVVNNNANPVVISEYVLISAMKWGTTAISSWADSDCEVRSWLNQTFYNEAFDTADKENIKFSTIANNSLTDMTEGAGESTEDNVWLLSINEIRKYFPTNDERKSIPTDFILANGAYMDRTRNSYYWTRTINSSWQGATRVAFIDEYGNENKTDARYTKEIRPALTLNI